VTVQVRLFAGLRERAGAGSLELEVPDGAVVGDVWPALGLGDEPPGLLFALNRAYAERSAPLSPGDEVAVIPPVSGGAATADPAGGGAPGNARGSEPRSASTAATEPADVVSGSEPRARFRLSAEPLSIERAVAEVRTPAAGAVATFVGTTRARSRGRDVRYLEYEAYEGMAERVMAELADALRARHELCEVAIHHRLGRVEVGDTSVVIAVSAPHRAAALAACREAIDELKVTVPLWKKEVYEGGEEWIGRGS
jgi:molybdopterin synthase catalytic subunit